ncbi:hypothetical protein [Mycobacterium sp. CnD-18-1]|uniref:hypothetical protein n=1 Tax=Mycobacterium sp. CnD-18-1 TaxID=2917744 RepID=UPI001EF1C2F0|nr:hypothetical protein [Mycobacterium sp. CnD-18-1]MCG7607159.1 hypothetical protein [Mycobacterium sp. CnD-18-1]
MDQHVEPSGHLMDEREYVISFTLTTQLEKALVEAMAEQMVDDSLFSYIELGEVTVEEVS